MSAEKTELVVISARMGGEHLEKVLEAVIRTLSIAAESIHIFSQSADSITDDQRRALIDALANGHMEAYMPLRNR